MSSAINNRLAVLNGYYAELDALIAVQDRIVDTYEGMLSLCNNGEGADHILVSLDKAQAERTALLADRVECDLLWNEALLSAEAA